MSAITIAAQASDNRDVTPATGTSLTTGAKDNTRVSLIVGWAEPSCATASTVAVATSVRAAPLAGAADFDSLETLVAAMRSGNTGESYAEYCGITAQHAGFPAFIAHESGNLLLHATLVRLRPRAHRKR